MRAETEIEALLKRTTGLDSISLGPGGVQRVIRERMAQYELKELSEYATYLQQSEAEFNELIERVVVPETWFFRDREAFAALSRFAVSEWLPANPSGQLRL